MNEIRCFPGRDSFEAKNRIRGKFFVFTRRARNKEAASAGAALSVATWCTAQPPSFRLIPMRCTGSHSCLCSQQSVWVCSSSSPNLGPVKHNVRASRFSTIHTLLRVWFGLILSLQCSNEPLDNESKTEHSEGHGSHRPLRQSEKRGYSFLSCT